MSKTNTNADIQVIYSFRIKTLLGLRGFQPISETENPKDSRYKCWVFEASPAFLEAFIELAGKEGYHG